MHIDSTMLQLIGINPAKFRVDYKAIAQGLYDMFDDEEQACMAFGMAPATKMQIVEQELRQRFGQIIAEYFDAADLVEGFANAVNKNYLNKCIRQIHIELLEQAKKAGKLVV